MSYLSVPENSAPLAAARERFHRFHGFQASRVERAAMARTPGVLVALGDLRGVIYRSDRGQAGRPRTFVHFFRNPPRLLCDPDGRQLHIHGGEYRITRLGLED